MPVRDYSAKAVIKITSTSHTEDQAIKQFERFLRSASQWFVKVELTTEPEWERLTEETESG